MQRIAAIVQPVDVGVERVEVDRAAAGRERGHDRGDDAAHAHRRVPAWKAPAGQLLDLGGVEDREVAGDRLLERRHRAAELEPALGAVGEQAGEEAR